MIFDRPNAALFRYENRMARKPRNWPPTSHSVPTLWERARTLFDATVSTVGSAFALAYRQSFRRNERRELLIRLAPIEKLVRTLLVIEAITWLLMTPEGLRMRRAARACTIPTARPQSSSRSPDAASIVPHTEAVKERARADAASEFSAVDPPEWQCRFGILHWAPDALDTRDWVRPREAAKAGVRARPWVCLLDDPLPQRPAPPSINVEDDDDLTGPALTLARRLEALRRVIETPEPSIRRLAARLASIPREYFPLPPLARTDAALWWHGRPEYYNAHALVVRAILAFDRALAHTPLQPRDLDPG